MIIPHGATDRKVAFVAVDITDLKTRETSTGITGGSWDVWYSLNGGTLTQDATPTVTELSSSNAPGVWVYDVDVAAQTTLPTGVTTAELTLHIAYEIASTPSIMAPVTRTVTVSAGENAITCGTAASAGASTLSLASGETFADDELIGCVAEIVSGTGRGQVRVITDYAATGDQATIAPNWTVTPSGTILYVIRSGSVKATTLGTDAVNSDSIADANEFEPASDPVNYLTTGTAFAGGLSTITLVSPAVATANYYRHNLIHLISGTGAGQSRVITDYTAGRVATVDTNWTTNPSTDTVYAVLAQRVPPIDSSGLLLGDVIHSGTATGGASSTIDLATTASATNDYYNFALIQIVGGTGAGQTRVVRDYVGGTTQQVTVWRSWDTTPDTTSVYAIRAADTPLVTGNGYAQADTRAIAGDLNAPYEQYRGVEAVIGVRVNDGSPTSTGAVLAAQTGSALPPADIASWTRRIYFTSGTLLGQQRPITAWTQSTNTAVWDAFPSAPANNDTAVII
jgi:hypothetical protein